MIQKELSNFNLKQIADSGQCFRMVPVSAPGSGMSAYSVVSGTRFLLVMQKPGSNLTAFSCGAEDFPFWESYFDLQTDYQAFIDSVNPEDAYLKAAAAKGSGIRILRQDPWEMIITFIISQQKTIPAIRSLVEALSRQYGTRLDGTQESVLSFCAGVGISVPPGQSAGLFSGSSGDVYSFPTPEQLAKASLDDLLSLKLGYRAKYIHRVCQDACEGVLDLKYLSALDYASAMEYLIKFYGIGEKVANCICLFGLHHIDAFPVDTWIRKILMREYAPRSRALDTAAKSKIYDILIQENFSQYQGYAGVMQQYIFYFERMFAETKMPQIQN